jgi:hypothetical protein
MSGSASDYLESAWLKHVLRLTAYPQPAGLWLAALLTHGGDSGGTEPTGGSYARVPAGTFTVSGSSPTEGVNDAAIEFPAASAAWGDVAYCALYDALTGGNQLLHSPLLDTNGQPTTVMVAAKDVLRIAPGALRVRAS